MKADPWRGLDFYKSIKDNNRVLIVGVGHTGSYIAYGLARLGVRKISICDYDHVEAHNLPNQFFSETLLKDYNEEEKKILKVTALTKTIQMIIPGFAFEVIFMDKVETIAPEILADYDVVIFGVDDMDVRAYMFNKMEKDVGLIIDPRTGGEYCRIFAIRSRENIDSCNEIYRESLHANEEAVDLPCTGQAVVDVAMAVAGECVGRYRHYVNKTLKQMETFHDYATCSHGIMNMYNDGKDKSKIIRDGGFINSLGGHVEDNRNDS